MPKRIPGTGQVLIDPTKLPVQLTYDYATMILVRDRHPISRVAAREVLADAQAHHARLSQQTLYRAGTCPPNCVYCAQEDQLLSALATCIAYLTKLLEPCHAPSRV